MGEEREDIFQMRCWTTSKKKDCQASDRSGGGGTGVVTPRGKGGARKPAGPSRKITSAGELIGAAFRVHAAKNGSSGRWWTSEKNVQERY